MTFSSWNPGARTSMDGVITVRLASAYGLRMRMLGFVTTRLSRYVPGATEITAPSGGATSIARWIDQ